jgi:hypothetical protein
MEFLRFGSSIPGSYWGCCACCIIQNFKVDPDAKASIQLVSGDGGGPLTKGKEMLFAGPTYRDIFNQRIRSGTFDSRDMPNHAFIAILTDWQIKSGYGKQWLAILRETGFEFIRSVSNSVYGGASLGKPSGKGGSQNYIFALVRNIGSGASADPFTPPKEWQDLPKVKSEFWDAGTGGDAAKSKALALEQHAQDTAIWNALGAPKFLTESEVVAAGSPVTLAGLRSEFPQELAEVRKSKQEAKQPTKTKAAAGSDPFAAKAA